MDNITHTLSGALAARALRSTGGNDARARRALFWLFLVAANLPDVDIIARFVTDPITALGYHRGMTHSFLVAPLFALLPALAFYRFGPLKNLRLLWLCACLGIAIHIVLDLVTPFGTQVFLPLSARRFSLDWMFIIDPFFTLLMAAGVWAARRWSSWLGAANAVIILVAGYLAVEAVSHQIAETRVAEYARRQGLDTERISAFPQPFNIFRWMGIIQTGDGARQMFFTLFDDTIAATAFPSSHSPFAQQSMATPEARWFMSYARHPWVRELQDADSTVVEFRDLQFAVDPSLARKFGLPERDFPFVLRYVYSPAGRLREVRLDRSVLRREGGV